MILPIPYSEKDLTLNKGVQQVPIIFSWENLTVQTVFNPKKSFLYKKIINNVSGVAKPGNFLAIMGGPGVGKTTLLNALNFRNGSNLNITGSIKVNGQIVNSFAALSDVSGYIQQESFFSTLKVKEHLKFLAKLKLGKKYSKEEIYKRVEEVMEQFDLKKCEHNLIGNIDENFKGLSGREKKRLSFACELITNPNLLFVEDPTSGLDSFAALSTIECLRRLAYQGRTIICTIHQPNSEIFEMVSTLCLLAHDGNLAYFGARENASRFFEEVGFNVPLVNFNPADWYLRKLNLEIIKNEESERDIKVCFFPLDPYATIMSNFWQHFRIRHETQNTNKYNLF